MKKKRSRHLLIPGVAVALFTVLSITGRLEPLENDMYDRLLGLRASPPEYPGLLHVDFDDRSIELSGAWPVGRHIFADGLVLMRELGAEGAVFDIEYMNESPRGVNSAVLERDIPARFDAELGYLSRSIVDLFSAVSAGMIPLEEAEAYVADLAGLAEAAKTTLLEEVGSIVRDNDEYLGAAVRLFGNAFMGVHYELYPDPTIPSELKRYLMDRLSLGNVTVTGSGPKQAAEIRPSIMPILRNARSVGFTNVPIDRDGVQRRLDLIVSHENAFIAQLGFSAALRLLGEPAIEISDRAIRLVAAKVPGKDPRDIRIPLTENRQVLLNWPHKEYNDSYRHLSFSRLILHDKLFSDLETNLVSREDWGYLSLATDDSGTPVTDLLAYARSLREELLADETDDERREGLFEEYRAVREHILGVLERFLSAETERTMLDEVGLVLAEPALSPQLRETYRIISEDLPVFFDRTRTLHADLVTLRRELSADLSGSYCFLGHTGTGTTDIGVTQFDQEFRNVGTHTAIVNMIVSGEFLDDSPGWIPVLIAAASSFLLAFIIRSMKPLHSIITGVLFTLGLTAAISAVFVVTGTYVGVLTPSLCVLLVFITMTADGFLTVESEKGFYRKAFSHYLSTEVINTLVAHPERLTLGGEKKFMTAMFTDIRGFSTISEQLDPESLVRLLNLYLTEMSDIVLDLKGTIDKYEGDAIIAFWGAPLDLSDHAERAVLAAVRMKRAERLLNERFLESNASPAPLFTRIGINTGEMVVGNMGTIKKMDYTIIGDSVNLAARLEGVNKNYGTAVVVSEETCSLAGTGFVTRKLDRIRVVGIKRPIRIYEIVEEKGRIDAVTEELLRCFAEALERFEERNWSRAEALFERCAEMNPEDGPTDHYLKLTRKFIQEEPAASWDGVFSLTSK
jgi:adenylate cyclase